MLYFFIEKIKCFFSSSLSIIQKATLFPLLLISWITAILRRACYFGQSSIGKLYNFFSSSMNRSLSLIYASFSNITYLFYWVKILVLDGCNFGFSLFKKLLSLPKIIIFRTWSFANQVFLFGQRSAFFIFQILSKGLRRVFLAFKKIVNFPFYALRKIYCFVKSVVTNSFGAARSFLFLFLNYFSQALFLFIGLVDHLLNVISRFFEYFISDKLLLIQNYFLRFLKLPALFFVSLAFFLKRLNRKVYDLFSSVSVYFFSFLERSINLTGNFFEDSVPRRVSYAQAKVSGFMVFSVCGIKSLFSSVANKIIYGFDSLAGLILNVCRLMLGLFANFFVRFFTLLRTVLIMAKRYVSLAVNNVYKGQTFVFRLFCSFFKRVGSLIRGLAFGLLCKLRSVYSLMKLGASLAGKFFALRGLSLKLALLKSLDLFSRSLLFSVGIFDRGLNFVSGFLEYSLPDIFNVATSWVSGFVLCAKKGFFKARSLVGLSAQKLFGCFYRFYAWARFSFVYLRDSLFSGLSKLHRLVFALSENLSWLVCRAKNFLHLLITALKISFSRILDFSKSGFGVAWNLTKSYWFLARAKISGFFQSQFVYQRAIVVRGKDLAVRPGYMLFDGFVYLKEVDYKSYLLRAFQSLSYSACDSDNQIKYKNYLILTMIFFWGSFSLREFGIIKKKSFDSSVLRVAIDPFATVVNVGMSVTGIYEKKDVFLTEAKIKFVVEVGAESLDVLDNFEIVGAKILEKKVIDSVSTLSDTTLNYYVKFELPQEVVGRSEFPFLTKQMPIVLKNSSAFAQEMRYQALDKDFVVKPSGIKNLQLRSKTLVSGVASDEMSNGSVFQYPAVGFVAELRDSGLSAFWLILFTVMPLILGLVLICFGAMNHLLILMNSIFLIALFFLNRSVSKIYNTACSYYDILLYCVLFYLIVISLVAILDLARKHFKIESLEFVKKLNFFLFLAANLTLIFLSCFWL